MAECTYRNRGAVTVWVAVLLAVILVGFGGLVHDAASLNTERARASSTAWSLARVGVSQSGLSADGLGIDKSKAERAIERIADEKWPEYIVNIDVGSHEVSVQIEGSYQPKLLTKFGFDRWQYSVTRSAVMVDYTR